MERGEKTTRRARFAAGNAGNSNIHDMPAVFKTTPVFLPSPSPDEIFLFRSLWAMERGQG
jgi:hypothetical protein